MKIDEGLDTGPILGEITTPIGPVETGGSLTSRLAFLGATIIDDTVPEYLNNRRRPVPQIASGASHARMLTKAEARLRPDIDANDAERLIRAFHPRPISWVESSAGVLRIHGARPCDIVGKPGEISFVGTRVIAYFNRGSIEVLTVQPPGKPLTDAASWMHGRRGEVVTFQ